MPKALNTTGPGNITLEDEGTAITRPISDRKRSTVASANVVVDIAVRSHQGLVRANNEDSFLINTLERRMTTLRTNLPPGQLPENYLEIVYGMIVADGMGGAAAGEVASRTAIVELLDLIIATPDWIMRLDEEGANRVLDRTEKRIEQLAPAFMEATRIDPKLSGMGTTLTVAASLGSDLLIAHVGDSRAYLFTEGQLIQLTKDQTMAQLLVDIGVISADALATHRARHILTSAITASGSKIEVELHHLHLADGDRLLLCSDGLTDMVSDNDIKGFLRDGTTAAEICQLLVDAALSAGGKDNITVISANYQIPGQA